MKTILLFSGSNSSTSINQQLIEYTATLFDEVETKVIDLRNYEPPMFSVDLETEVVVHPKIAALVQLIDDVDGIVISTPEHNSMPPAFFKNILDWLSRVKKMTGSEKQYLEDKPLLLMSTSNGKKGAVMGRATAKIILNYAKPNWIGEYSLPEFTVNFQGGKVANKELNNELIELVKQLEKEVLS